MPFVLEARGGWRRAVRLLALGTALLGAVSCSPSESPSADEKAEDETTVASAGPALPAPGAASERSLLLVTLDTTRADRLGCYGATGAETPTLDALARRGLLFTDAVSPVPMTLPAHASLLTGLDPPGHGVRANGDYALAPDAVTLAEVLQGAGYRTAAFVSSFVLDPRFGLDQGFDVYDARLEATRQAAFAPQTERSAEAVTAAAIAWLRNGAAVAGADAGPFFLWVHYFDPHDPYEPPEPFRSRFRDRPYEGEIAYVDRELGRLLAALEASGVGDETVIVVAGDHGESLGEHHELYHSRTLYEGAVHVPLIVALPSVVAGSAGRVEDRVVSLVDLFPTVLELLGIAVPGEPDGRSLLSQPADGDRIVYLETLNTYLDNGWAPLYAARRHHEKYVLAPRPELYDLESDPDESRNLLPGEPESARRASELRRYLVSRVGEDLPEPPDPAAGGDPEVRRRLEALGYVTPGGGPTDEVTAPGDLPDPKDVLPLLEELNEGRRRMAAGEPMEAARRARRVLAESPRDRSALQLLAEAYAVLGRTEEAERALRRHLEIGPSVAAAVLLAQVVLQQGRFDEAEALLDRAAELEPRHGAVPLARGDLRLAQGRPGEALALYRRAAEVDPYRFAGLAQARIERVESLLGRR